MRCFVDLAGSGLKDDRAFAGIVTTTLQLRPAVILMNLFFQLSRCQAYAAAIRDMYEEWPKGTELVLRLRGNGDEEARRLLQDLPIVVHRDMVTACRLAVDIAIKQPKPA